MKQPILLIPGMMCDARLFSPQIQALYNHPITVMPIFEHDSMTALAQAILAHAPPHFALAGLSMGGIVAMEILRLAPQRVKRLALMDTNPLAETEEVQQNRLPQMEAVQQGNLQAIMRDTFIPRYLAQTPQKSKIEKLCMDMALTLGPNVFIRQSIALKNRPDQCKPLSQYQGKSLILHGAEDQLCPQERHQLMHTLLPHAHYTIIQQAGHLPTLEAPKATNHALKQWLA